MISGPVGPPTGGRFDFEDGGSYVGAWEDGKAHGYGICTGPKNQGEYDGLWQYGFEASGVYTWPSNHTYAGQWGAGKRNGLGVENKGRWSYKGEWTFGFKGRYGVRESTESGAKYEGTWTTGLQDGYGVETYADHGTYTGQWMRGSRHGYGVRRSAAFGIAARYSNTQQRSSSITSLPSHDDADKQLHERDKVMLNNRGGFVLTGFTDSLGSNATLTDTTNSKMGASNRSTSLDKQTGSVRKSLFKRLKKQKSTGDLALDSQNSNARNVTGSLRSTASSTLNYPTESSLTLASKKSNSSFVHHGLNAEEQLEPNVVEIYLGEWKNDKRSGVGVCERSDGLKYEGEWYNNKKNGYGRTTYRDGRKEEGKYKNNVLIASEKKHKLLLLRLSKLKERVDSAVHSSKQAAEIALQKAEIASARQQTARTCGDDAEKAASEARCNAEFARQKAREYGHTPNTGSSPNGRPNAAATPHAEPAYESKYADADFRPGERADLLLRSTILQDHFDKYGASADGTKPQPPRPAELSASPNAQINNSDAVSGRLAQAPANIPTSPSISLTPPVSEPANSSPLVSTMQPKSLTRYSTVPAQDSASHGNSTLSVANAASTANSFTGTTNIYTKHTPANHVNRAEHIRAASLARHVDSAPQPSIANTMATANSGTTPPSALYTPTLATVSPPASTPQTPSPTSTSTSNTPMMLASQPPTPAPAYSQGTTFADAAPPLTNQSSASNTLVKRTAPTPNVDTNNVTLKGAAPNSGNSSGQARTKRRGSLPDVNAAGQVADDELHRLKDEVLRRREQERAWRETPVGLMVHRINQTLDWCNRHTGFVVVLTVLSINFLFICIFLSYYNKSFGQAADDKRKSGV